MCKVAFSHPGVRVGAGGWPIEGPRGHPRESTQTTVCRGVVLVDTEGRCKEFPGPCPGKLGPWMELLNPLEESLRHVEGLL